jgi:tetratricopeptide (TPR) repeat protein
MLGMGVALAAGIVGCRQTGDGSSPPASYSTAVAAWREGRTAAAEEGLRSALREDPNHAATYADLGNLYLLQKSLPAAIQALETASYREPKNPEPRTRLAQAYVDSRRYEEARRAIDQAIVLDPKSAYALTVRGELLLRQDRLKDSLADFRAAIQLDPEFSLAYMKAGFILNELQRFKEAIPVLEEGVKRDPNNPGMHFQLAESYFSQPQNPKAMELAEQQYRLAIPNNPSVANVHARLGELAHRRGDETGAREQWETALRLSDTETTALYGLAQLEARAGNRTRSAELTRHLTSIRNSLAQLTELKTKAETDPRNVALAIRAVRLALSGQVYADASRLIERAVRWNPDNRTLRELRGQVYLEQGFLEEARAEFAVAERLLDPK